MSDAAADNDNRVRVLLVEDDEDDVVLTRQMLADIAPSRFDLEWASDYDRGLERLCAGCHDICLVDYYLGLRNGVDFVREATGRDCRVPVILLTGMGNHAVDLAAMNAGAADYLSKSDLQPPVLDRAIRYAMQQRRTEEQRVRLLIEQAARSRAESANRAKDEFLAALSHELRTPLTPVLIAVEGLEHEPDVPERVREAVALIKRNVELEARLIDDLLDLTRVAHRKLSLRRDAVDVHAELRHAIDTCGHNPDGGKRVTLAVRADAARHHVTGDAARLQQVFWNLLKNAFKFTPEGGRIDVRTGNENGVPALAGTGIPAGVPALATNADLPPSPRLFVEVTDTGIGIDPAALPKIFNAFEQADPSVTRQFGGLGLGLAICKALVELHHGTITAHSAGRGAGTTFRVTLPTVPAPRPVAAGEGPGLPRPTKAAGERILLVEDHPDTRRVMGKLLERRGYAVATAGGVAEALESARCSAFDLVISDIGLPDGTGLELMRELRRMGPVRAIALTGYGMEDDILNSEQAGFAEHLTKPVSFPQLEQAVARVLHAPVPGTVV